MSFVKFGYKLWIKDGFIFQSDLSKGFQFIRHTKHRLCTSNTEALTIKACLFYSMRSFLASVIISSTQKFVKRPPFHVLPKSSYKGLLNAPKAYYPDSKAY
jgi:hypothetical protein